MRIFTLWVVFFIFSVNSSWLHADSDPVSSEPAEDVQTGGSDESTILCQNLREKIEIFSPLQEKVADDFSLISDKALCHSMSEQCEYFYGKIREYNKSFKQECHAEHVIPKIEKCDYEANPCVKEVKPNPLRARTAGL